MAELALTGILGEVSVTAGPDAVKVHPKAFAVTKVQVDTTVPVVESELNRLVCGSIKYSPGRLSCGSFPASWMFAGCCGTTLKKRSTARTVGLKLLPAVCVVMVTTVLPVAVPGAPNCGGTKT